MAYDAFWKTNDDVKILQSQKQAQKLFGHSTTEEQAEEQACLIKNFY